MKGFFYFLLTTRIGSTVLIPSSSSPIKSLNRQAETIADADFSNASKPRISSHHRTCKRVAINTFTPMDAQIRNQGENDGQGKSLISS